jgi:beta-galactosidase
MTKAGISIVRMAEFAWSRLEPEHGRYEFAWLDRILDTFQAGGIHVVLGTPTAAPPAWLHAMHPDIYPVDKRRYRLGFGTREQRCMNNDRMRVHSRRIVEALAQRFADHPAIIGWQTDNELSGNLCYCPVCEQKFRVWLREKYGSLEALNRAWGTAFWSQEYSDWQQIPLPWQAKCGDQHNPSLQLEFRRFQSNAAVEFQHEQVAILRELAPHHFITHNMMGTHSSLDYYALGRDLDFVSWDNYPITPWCQSPFGTALAADVMRGIKQRGVWVMEQQNGIAGWDKVQRRPSGAWLRCAAWQTIAHGADAVVFFRWDSARHGTEQYWHGIVNHDRVPRRRYREVVEFSQEMRELAVALEGTEVHSEVAILNSYEQHFAFDIQPQVEGLAIWDQVGRYYRALRGSGLNVDIVPITCDLSRYKFIVAPSWYIMTEEDAARLVEYVLNGGTLVLSPRTGVKNGVNACHAEPLPSLLREAAGVEVDDYDPLGKDETIVRTGSGATHTVTVWADALVLHGADAVAHYAGTVYAGEPAITRNRFGEGTVYYFGTYGEPALYHELLNQILDEVGIRDRFQTPEGVDTAWREGEHARYLFLINFNDSEQIVAVPVGMTRLLGGAAPVGAVTLPAFGVAIFQGVPSSGRGEEDAELGRRAAAATM